MRVGEGITGNAAELLEPIAIPHSAHLDPRFRGFTNLDEHAFESILAVPVLARGKLAGALNVRTYEPREYDEDEVALLLTIAAQLGQAIENARLWGRSQRRIAELEALDRIARVVHSPIDLDEALADVVRTAAKAAHADVCALALPPSPGQPFEVTVRSSDERRDDRDARRRRTQGAVRRAGTARGARSRRAAAASARSSARASAGRRSRAPSARCSARSPPRPPRPSSARAARCAACSPRRSTTGSRTTCRPWPRCCGSPPPRGSDPHRALRDSVGRVLSIAEVHDLLTSTHEEDVDGADLIRRLTSMLCQTVGGQRRPRRRSRRSCCGPIARPRSRWSTASCTRTPWSTAAAFGISF